MTQAENLLILIGLFGIPLAGAIKKYVGNDWRGYILTAVLSFILGSASMALFADASLGELLGDKTFLIASIGAASVAFELLWPAVQKTYKALRTYFF